MSVARTCARRRRQMRNDKRYGPNKATPISKKLQGRAKMLALTERVRVAT